MFDTGRYLERIGLSLGWLTEPDAALLGVLHEAHLAIVPAMCWWQQNSPLPPFTRNTVCTLQSDERRVTMTDRRLIRTEHGQRFEQQLTDDTDVLSTYLTYFGIELEPLPRGGSGALSAPVT